MQATIPLIGVIILAFVINVPCGYIRQNYRKYSFMWFLLIHVPIPFIVFLRVAAGLDLHVIPMTLGGAIAGQVVGGMISQRRKQHGQKK